MYRELGIGGITKTTIAEVRERSVYGTMSSPTERAELGCILNRGIFLMVLKYFSFFVQRKLNYFLLQG